MDDPLLRWRDEFPILAPTTCLISHSLERCRRYSPVHDDLEAELAFLNDHIAPFLK